MQAFNPIAYINEPRWQESRLGLERISELLNRMGRPQDRLRFVHVAGTNGKGSTCAYLDSILRCAGLRVGLFTSPYIREFEERIRVNGENISAAALSQVTLFVRDHAEAAAAETGEHPTEFELMCAVAFEHFARCGCDIVVCEVGLGGRLDSTNVISSPEACVITRIGLDHTDILGTTLEQIAREKAGIIKPGAPVVSWPQDAGAMDEVVRHARALGNEVRVPDFAQLAIGKVEGIRRRFAYRGLNFSTRLLGSYQPANATLAIETAWLLRELGWQIPDAAVERGVSRAAWPGRFEIISPLEMAGADVSADEKPIASMATSSDPLGDDPSGLATGTPRSSAGGAAREDARCEGPIVIVDGGHNPQGATVLAESLRDVFPGRRIVFVMGVLADKDYRGMIAAVAPLAEAFVCATPPNPRSLAASELAEVVREMLTGQDVSVEVVEEPGAALGRASELAGRDGIVCAFGSLYSISLLKP